MEKFKIYGENGENQNQMNSSVTKNVLKVKDPVFRQICSAFATVAVWYDTNLSVLHTVLTKVMFPKCTSFLDAESAVSKESS